MRLVPNEFPTIDLDARLAIIGEAPGQQEETFGRPFIGPSGDMLNNALQKNGLMRSACFVGNVCQYRPPNNKIEMLSWDGEEIQYGLKTLAKDIVTFDPKCVFLLGTTAAKAAGVSIKVTSLRGSMFLCNDETSPFFMRKCVASVNPAAVLRDYSLHPLFRFDVKRAVAQAAFAELRLPQRTYDIDLTVEQIATRLQSIQPGEMMSLDIEGGIKKGITCIGISTDPSNAFVFDPTDFGEEGQLYIMRELAKVLRNDVIPKVLQNSLYDNFVLSYLWRMPIRNVRHDTMLSGFEIYPELPKGLDTQTSIYTDEPYYKFERKIEDKRTHKIYCGKDAAVTLEIAQKHIAIIKGASLDHYEFNMSLLPAFNYMEQRGFNYNVALAKEKLSEVVAKQAEYQAQMETLSTCKEINPNCNKGANSLANILYNKCGFEPQYAIEKGRKTDRKTANVDALLTLMKKTEHPLISAILKWRVQEGKRKQLSIETDKDGRMRCAYNIVGTETCRVTCYESPTETGTNLQTITEDLHCLYMADEEKTMIKCDLKGADGWTVAAHANKHGDTTMLLDYFAKVKPAQVIASAHLQGPHIVTMSQADLRSLIPTLDIEDWLYFACKRVQHGSSYRLGERRMSTQILVDSWNKMGNPIYIAPTECKKLQSLFFMRYRGILDWQRWAEAECNQKRAMTCFSGNTRQFFGRPFDYETVNEFLAHEPQHNTTYATNLALHRLWHDPGNWSSVGLPIIEPLHHVHDALIAQVSTDRLEWAKERIRSYFDNPLTIAEQSITIPFDGRLGPDWGTLEEWE